MARRRGARQAPRLPRRVPPPRLPRPQQAPRPQRAPRPRCPPRRQPPLPPRLARPPPTRRTRRAARSPRPARRSRHRSEREVVATGNSFQDGSRRTGTSDDTYRRARTFWQTSSSRTRATYPAPRPSKSPVADRTPARSARRCAELLFQKFRVHHSRPDCTLLPGGTNRAASVGKLLKVSDHPRGAGTNIHIEGHIRSSRNSSDTAHHS
mmetsp:Transcript_26163/g.67914  ORF Transcript_26163/g.67914 Transcript_26163/m.67914 type:complete len:209 (-) Transcript_26163:403-1029(-)